MNIICQGYHLDKPVLIDEDEPPTLVSFPYVDSEEKAEGWEKTTYFKFNGDGKTVVWLCPDCAKRWNEEKQERINNILDMATKKEYLSRQIFLYGELINLGATDTQKVEFNQRVITTERGEK